MDNSLHLGLGIFGSIIAMFLFLSPMITFKRVIMNRSTEQFSGIPYVVTLLNCLLTCWYGLPFVSPNNIVVAILNGSGAALEAIYVLIFIIFAPKKEKGKILAFLTLVLTLFSAIAFVSVFFLHGKNRNQLCGIASTIFCIIMFASPLSIMRLVIKTKSVEFMPFFMSLFIFVASTSFFIFGLLENDPFLSVPNGFGCGLGAIQLILYAIYRKNNNNNNNKGDATEKPIKDESSMEMGLSKPFQQHQKHPDMKNSHNNGLV